MKSYSVKEKLIARYISYIPFLKEPIKFLYSLIMYSLNKNKEKMKSYNKIDRVYIGDNLESFGGYYDKYPQNNCGLVLCHISDHDTSKRPESRYSIYVSVIDLKSNTLIWKNNTRAYNWQQGARLQWLNNSLFAFNDFDIQKMKFITRIIDIDGFKEISSYNRPLQDSYKDEYFLSINYKRLFTLQPEYGYDNLGKMNKKELKELNNDGIWKVDYKTKREELLINFEKIVQLEYKDLYFNSNHYINHVMISPDGKNFIFIHRFLKKGKRYDRLICVDSESAEMKVLSDNEMVSHCCWINNNEIIGYLRGDNKIEGYWIINVYKNEKDIIKLFGGNTYGDGHPSTDGEKVISDSYPDKGRNQQLWYFNIDNGENKEIGSFYHGFKYWGISRCDLHPRTFKEKEFIFFDSVFDGNRQMYYVKGPL